MAVTTGFGLPIRPIGINPNAPLPPEIPSPDPRIPAPQGPGVPQGPGIPQQQPGFGLGAELGMGQATSQMSPGAAPPTDLSGLSGLEKIGLVLQNTGAGLQGQTQMPTTMRMQQLRQQYNEKRQQFMQTVEMLDNIHKQLGDVPIKERPGWIAAHRAQFVDLAGGSPDAAKMYDGVVGANSGQGVIDLYKDNPLVQSMIAGGQSVNDIMRFQNSPLGQQMTMQLQDQKNLPIADQAVDRLMNDPKLRPEIERLIASRRTKYGDGKLTIEDLEAINAKASRGPGGTQIPFDVMNTILRNEDHFGQRPGFRTSAAQQELQKAIDLQPLELEKILARQKAAGSGQGGLNPGQQKWLLKAFDKSEKVITDNDTLLDGFTEADAVLAKAQKILESGKVTTNFVAGKPVFLAAQKLGGNEADVNVVEQAFGQEFFTKLQSLRGLMGQLSNEEGARISATTGGAAKNAQFNIDDLKARRAAIRSIGTRKLDERNAGVRSQKKSAELLELGDAFEARPERKWAPSGDNGSGQALPPPAKGMVRMIAPDGSIGDLPEGSEAAKKAEAAGAKVAM